MSKNIFVMLWLADRVAVVVKDDKKLSNKVLDIEKKRINELDNRYC
jgi:hypothetical protein